MILIQTLSSLFQFQHRKPQPKDIQWLSYHIPKTAGSSLRQMLYKEFGRSRVFSVYRPDEAKKFGKGNAIPIRISASVVHGHFKPHPKHSELFPNAHSMVWVRDPIQRIWSLVGHLLDLQWKHPHYEMLHNLYVIKGIESQHDIVERIIKDSSIPYMVNAYSRFFSAVDIRDFSFVGSMHSFATSIELLNKEFNLSLKPLHRNSRTKAGIPQSLGNLKYLMEHEYSLVDDYL
ncbi:hypothetical protein ACOJR9_16595 [Alteromonas sp. A081]|uniref:hypothetical protein n=1 Tax=Alteromonas sp. A081 TaxID=3410269 RepID=UPI003B9836DF